MYLYICFMEFKGICHKKPKTLLMKVTSRSRPKILLKTISEYIRLANDASNMVWLFTFDMDDELCATGSFAKQLMDLFEKECGQNTNVGICVGTSKNKIDAINRDVEKVKGHWDVLVCVSDDQRPIVPGYDDIIRNAMPNHLDASLWFYDGGQMRINTMEILGRVYYDRQGFIYDPRFKSFFCDNLSTELAKKAGKLIQSKQCIIRHDHPGWNRVPDITRDALYERNDTYWKHDEELYKKLSAELI